MDAGSTSLFMKRKIYRFKKDVFRLINFKHGSIGKLEPAEYRFYFASQQIFFVTLIAHVFFLLLFVYLNIPELIIFNVVSIAAYIYCMGLNRNNKFLSAITIAFIEINAHAIIATEFIGWDSGFYYYLIGVGPVAFLNERLSMTTKIVYSIISMLVLIVLYNNYVSDVPEYVVEPSLLKSTYLINSVGLYIILSYFSFLYHWASKRSDKHLLSIGEKWEQLASVDMLTCLPNRRSMEERLQQEISRVYRGAAPFTLVIADIDDFKKINDSFGHIVGDYILKSLALIIREKLRKHDLVGRWGGEEFLILLPETDEQGAYDALQKVRSEISDALLKFNDEVIGATITMGACVYQHGDDLKDCIATADSALYEGKYGGKNKVVITYNKMLSLKL